MASGPAKGRPPISLRSRGIEAAAGAARKRITQITSFGVMMTPALVIDEEVKSVGRIPKLSQIIAWLEAADSKD